VGQARVLADVLQPVLLCYTASQLSPGSGAAPLCVHACCHDRAPKNVGSGVMARFRITPRRAGRQVSDFGLARDMDVLSKIETKTTGTVTHMAPEVLSRGVVSKAADVFSFGVLLCAPSALSRALVCLFLSSFRLLSQRLQG